MARCPHSLSYLKDGSPGAALLLTMATVLFFCPNMGLRVQGWFADDLSENGGEAYESVNCPACLQIHLVNPRTGRTLGPDQQ